MNTVSPEHPKTARLYFIDNLRVVLTIFVILHHVSLTYGASKGWYFYEGTDDRFTNLFLSIVLALNRTFVMGFFFFISAVFIPPAFDRKGPPAFLKERLIKLGIPLFLFSFLIRPSIVYSTKFDVLSSQYSFWENLYRFKNVAPGPTWFLEVLLVFCAAYTLYKLVLQCSGIRLSSNPAGRPAFPGNVAIVVFGLSLAVANFLVRASFPMEKMYLFLRVGSYPQYAGMLVAGIMAYRSNWLLAMPDDTGRLWLKITTVVLFLFIVFTSWAFYGGKLHALRGGLSWLALTQSLFDNFLCLGVVISGIHVFRRYFNSQGAMAKAMSADAYAVYIFHAPVIVAFTWFAQGILTGYPLFKFLLVFPLCVALCFVTSHLIRKLPLVKSVF